MLSLLTLGKDVCLRGSSCDGRWGLAVPQGGESRRLVAAHESLALFDLSSKADAGSKGLSPPEVSLLASANDAELARVHPLRDVLSAAAQKQSSLALPAARFVVQGLRECAATTTCGTDLHVWLLLETTARKAEFANKIRPALLQRTHVSSCRAKPRADPASSVEHHLFPWSSGGVVPSIQARGGGCAGFTGVLLI